MRGSRLLALFLALSVLLNILIIYRVLDRGVTLTHREDEFARLQEKHDVLARLLVAYLPGDTRSGLIEKAKAQGLELHDNGDKIIVGTVEFHAAGDRITGIEND